VTGPGERQSDDAPEFHVSTGTLPTWEQVDALTRRAFEHGLQATGGTVADYIPILAEADPELFGVCVAQVDGSTHTVGDSDAEFSIQSISKAFVFALVCEALGHDVVKQKLGANNTGLAFNSVVAIELNDGRPMNPMVNAGALVAAGLMPGETPAEQWEAIHRGLSSFAGRPLEVDEEVYRSETATNHRNHAIARLVDSYGRLRSDPEDVLDFYTKQCALRVSARDLALMGATLADGGVHPITGEQVVSAEACRDTLSMLAANGMYERSGEWLFDIGLPGKSGVSGGIVTVSPGKGGIGVFAPRLDSAGNSVRGQAVTSYLARALGLNIFASDVHPELRAGVR
jgi:glutaminase